MVAYSFKERFALPIRAGLGLIGLEHKGQEYPVEFVVDMGTLRSMPFDPERDLTPPVRPKRQTIRAIGAKRHAKPGEIIQLYTGMRTRNCKKIGEARCIEVLPIKMQIKFHSMPIILNGRAMGGAFSVDDFARMDGFDDSADMLKFWIKEHGVGHFRGVLIRWEAL